MEIKTNFVVNLDRLLHSLPAPPPMTEAERLAAKREFELHQKYLASAEFAALKLTPIGQ